MTQIITVVQEKGGAGKTTLLISIASLMVADGAKVAVIDTDPKDDLYDWADMGQTDLDYLFVKHDEELMPAIKKLKSSDAKYDAVLIDTAGFKSAMAVYAINAAGLVLIPSKANKGDAKGAIKTYAHVQSVAENMDKEIKSYVVMMDIDANTNITHAVLDAIDEQEIPRLNAVCAHRTGFKEMTTTGRGPEKSAKEAAKIVLAELQIRKALNYYGGEDGEVAA